MGRNVHSRHLHILRICFLQFPQTGFLDFPQLAQLPQVLFRPRGMEDDFEAVLKGLGRLSETEPEKNYLLFRFLFILF